jgi:hypothetical protein
MMNSPFAQAAPALYALGYSPIPVMAGKKMPGTTSPLRNWTSFCFKQPVPNLIAGWSRYPDLNVGVACGMGLICVDIDQEACMTALLNILPPSNVQKKGRKGISLFYRGNTDKIRSKNFRTPDRTGLVDLLAEGKQTVLPPSVHPDTNEPYFWWTDATLEDTPLDQLAELPDDIAENIGEALKEFGYDPNRERDSPDKEPLLGDTSSTPSIFRHVNNEALANLRAWVPHLKLSRFQAVANGFKAVAEWRSSGSGRPLWLRNFNLSFRPEGIRDFGDGRSYTPIDIVMAARRCNAGEALDWLIPLVGVQLHDPVAAVMAERIVASAKKKAVGYD